jgi:GNAT superfamily N-acetyltransferase
MRFLSPKRDLTPRELALLTDIDHVRHEAIAAVDQRDCSIVGVARYVRSGDGAPIAQVALEVADDLHRRGIGSELAKRISRRARANGLTLLAPRRCGRTGRPGRYCDSSGSRPARAKVASSTLG